MGRQGAAGREGAVMRGRTLSTKLTGYTRYCATKLPPPRPNLPNIVDHRRSTHSGGISLTSSVSLSHFFIKNNLTDNQINLAAALY